MYKPTFSTQCLKNQKNNFRQSKIMVRFILLWIAIVWVYLDWKAYNSGHVRRLPRQDSPSVGLHVRLFPMFVKFTFPIYFQTLIKITYIDLWIEIHLKWTAVTLIYSMRKARIRCLKSLEFAQPNACTYHDKCPYKFHAFEVFFYVILYINKA